MTELPSRIDSLRIWPNDLRLSSLLFFCFVAVAGTGAPGEPGESGEPGGLEGERFHRQFPGGQFGMQSLDQHLLQLLSERKITYEDALAKTSNPRDFEQRAARFRGAPAPAPAARTH